MTFTVDDVKSVGTEDDPKYIVKLIANVFGRTPYRITMDADGAEFIPYIGQEINLLAVPV